MCPFLVKKIWGFRWTKYEKKVVDTKMSLFFVCFSLLAINVIIRYRRDAASQYKAQNDATVLRSPFHRLSP
jgi:hypothetical protein